MRICSFLPSATEIVFALGLGDDLVGVTHECDYPPEAKQKAVVIDSVFHSEEHAASEIDRLVNQYAQRGISIYKVNQPLLEELRPDLIITQGLCDVCAVSTNETLRAVERLIPRPKVLSLDPTTFYDILDNMIAVGEATGRQKVAADLVARLQARAEKIKQQTETIRQRPRVFCLEWLEPPFCGGHWVPQMVDMAGGQTGIGKIGEPSFRVSWPEVARYDPEILVIMPCGFDIERTRRELGALQGQADWDGLSAVRGGRVFLVDANSYFSRPGPRIVIGLEILAQIIHPELFDYELPKNSLARLKFSA
jgi:iron complex transport system substrate-binding protein